MGVALCLAGLLAWVGVVAARYFNDRARYFDYHERYRELITWEVFDKPPLEGEEIESTYGYYCSGDGGPDGNYAEFVRGWRTNAGYSTEDVIVDLIIRGREDGLVATRHSPDSVVFTDPDCCEEGVHESVDVDLRDDDTIWISAHVVTDPYRPCDPFGNP
jgi:hypothetical protein